MTLLRKRYGIRDRRFCLFGQAYCAQHFVDFQFAERTRRNVGAHGQYRAGSGAEDHFRRRANQETVNTLSGMGSDDDEVDSVFVNPVRNYALNHDLTDQGLIGDARIFEEITSLRRESSSACWSNSKATGASTSVGIGGTTT